MQNELLRLSCFTDITRITVMAGGLSNPCFKIEADGSCYFAKKTTEPLFDIELKLTSLSANNNIAPPIHYYNEQWIVSHFIIGTDLAKSQLHLIDKVTIGIELMAKFHQLMSNSSPQTTKIQTTALSITQTINGLLLPTIKTELGNELEKITSRLNDLITPAIKHKSVTWVLCHSDINFSNVLLDTKQRAWLIDFEYACDAPIEFDIAMLMAINNIPRSMLTLVISLYEKQMGISLDKTLCNHLLLFSYLINGLWYYNKSLVAVAKTEHNFQDLAKQQWKLYDKLNNNLTVSSNNTLLISFI